MAKKVLLLFLMMLAPLAKANTIPGQQGECLAVCEQETGLSFVTCMKSCRGDEYPHQGGPLGEGYDWTVQGKAWMSVLGPDCPKGEKYCPVMDQALVKGGKNISHPCALNPQAPGCQRPVPERGLYLQSCKNDFNRLLKDGITGFSESQPQAMPPGKRILWTESAGLVYYPQVQDGRAEDKWLPSDLNHQRQFLVKDGHTFLPSRIEEEGSEKVTAYSQPYPYAGHDACFCPSDCQLRDYKREYCPSGFLSASTGQCCPNDCR